MRLIFLSLLLLGMSAGGLSADQGSPHVKKSTSGICHERGWPSYDRTTHFEPFNTMEECISSGGREAQNKPETFWSRLSKPKTWLAVIGAIAAASGAFWLQRRRRRVVAGSADDLERRRWEGHRRE